MEGNARIRTPAWPSPEIRGRDVCDSAVAQPGEGLVRTRAPACGSAEPARRAKILRRPDAARPARPGLRLRASPALRALFAALAFAAVPAAVAPAQDSADDVARRMDDRFFFVDALGRGWEPLLADVASVAESLPDSGRAPVLRVRDAAAEKYAGRRAAEGTEAGERRAFELWEMLSGGAVDEGRRPAFARKAAEVELLWAVRAEKAGDDARALELAHAAARRSPGFDAAYDLVAALGLKECGRAEDRDDFVAALGVLAESLKSLPDSAAARSRLAERRDRILATTGEISIDWLGDPARLAKVKGPKSDFSQARLELRPLAGQKQPPVQQAGRVMRVRAGRYAVSARGTGSAAFDAGQVEISSAGGRVTLIAALPDNMVLVPATGSVPAFLIDRTEVTVGEYASPGGANTGGNRTAASNVREADARRYAAASGKDLPSLAQWLIAAFGDPAGTSRRYPWGDQPPQPGVHFIGGEDRYEGPQSVDSCPAGASRHGCLNMAGNVMEWLDDGRFIGGSFVRDNFEKQAVRMDESTWPADYLRNPIYTHETWNALSPDQRNHFAGWRANEEGTTYRQVGLRCVVSLGSPRRNP